jgi:hypothetical protein
MPTQAGSIRLVALASLIGTTIELYTVLNGILIAAASA